MEVLIKNILRELSKKNWFNYAHFNLNMTWMIANEGETTLREQNTREQRCSLKWSQGWMDPRDFNEEC